MEMLLLEATNRKWYTAFSNSSNCPWRSHFPFQMGFFCTFMHQLANFWLTLCIVWSRVLLH